MEKHAYLIMAHDELYILARLVALLDDPRNDIFLHVDKQCKAFNPESIQACCQYSSLILLPRKRVSWGAFSQIQCEVDLLKTATKQGYSRYHLISGTDLPIKNQDEIHAFFEQYPSAEFIALHDNVMEQKEYLDRIALYYPLQEWIGHRRENNLLKFSSRALLKLQEVLHINRQKRFRDIPKKGTNWFSITHEFASYVVSQEKNIQRRYRWTLCADEIFLQTLAWNSHFREQITNDSKRYIDWKRGRPYTFRKTDFDELMQSNAFWARKFSEKVDLEIVEMIYQTLKGLEEPSLDRIEMEKQV